MPYLEEALDLLALDYLPRTGARHSELREPNGVQATIGAWLQSDRRPSKRLVGRRFEHLVREALLAHPGEWDRFDEVWLWNDWPERDGPDNGIDLVARRRETCGGGLVAIQAKYGQSPISTSEIDSFLAASEQFEGRLLVTNRPRIAASGQRKLVRARPRCEVLHTKDMDDWVPDWRDFVASSLPEDRIHFARHELRPYQKEALQAIEDGFARSSRGKLILPCGTGKSFIALRVAERAVGGRGAVLYLVPSIALMGQTMREWSRQRDPRLRHEYLAVCSDPTAGRRETSGDSALAGDLSELAMPVTTQAAALAEKLAKPVSERTMRVIFSTYHSTPVLAEAVAAVSEAGAESPPPGAVLPYRFDLIVSDEAHRTTGLTEAGAGAAEKRRLAKSRYLGISPFNLVHHDDHLPAARRLYMTATPRVFTSRQRRDLDEGGRYDDADSYSMDDPAVYGDEFYRMSFADAIDAGWLSDYRVLVIARSQADYESVAGSGGVTFEDGRAVDTESVVKLGGCWDALATPRSDGVLAGRRTGEVRTEWGAPARSAIAFCSTIQTSKKVAAAWERVAEWHRSRNEEGEFLAVDVDHLDASTPAVERASLIGGLRRHAEGESAPLCRMLTNVRVLSEGVDVPALDAVVFLESRSSPIDVTQAVGRVMRRTSEKDMGYIVIPVVVDQFGEGTPEERARRLLREGNFKPVWDVVRALRAHDERIDYWLNAKNSRNSPIVIVPNTIVDDSNVSEDEYAQMEIRFELSDQFASLLLDQCGDRNLYPKWGQRAALICRQVELRVNRLIVEHSAVRRAFSRFHLELQRLVGEQQITEAAAAEMVAQHVVTIPIFDHVVEASGFAEKNPLARALGSLLDVFGAHGHTFEEELRPLTRAYQSMERAFAGAMSGEERLNILKEIYESFFKAAMPAAVKSLGIVYTPVEIVDFMLRSVDAVCRREFDVGLTAEGVHVLDPFTGTGTFLNRLLTAKDARGDYLVREKDLDRKYGCAGGGEIHAAEHSSGEVHANELVLLAYYIAALKIEEARYQRKAEFARDEAGREAGSRGVGDGASRIYEPFRGMVLTDTFLLSEKQGNLPFRWRGLDEAGRRMTEQNRLPIRVIVGNPPWSAGRKAAGDEAVTVEYSEVESRVSETYVKEQALLPGARPDVKAMGNLYVKAFRWASDRLQGGDGIVALVTPNSLTDAPSLAGMRKALRDEFTDIYVVNLRGNAYKSGEERRDEGDPMFGQGTRNGTQITVLVRNRGQDEDGIADLHYVSVPDRYTLGEKFSWLQELGNVLSRDRLRVVRPTANQDWVNLSDPTYTSLMAVCDSSVNVAESGAITSKDALGVATNCDAYVYSFSYLRLCEKIEGLVEEFNHSLGEWERAGRPRKGDPAFERITSSGSLDRIKWTDRLKSTLMKGEPLDFDPRRIRQVLYRPFTKLWLYEDFRILSRGTRVAPMFPRDGSFDKPHNPPPAISLPPHHLSLQQGRLWSSRNRRSPGPPSRGNTASLSGGSASPAILITAPSNRTVFATLATDLHPLDPATRVVPRVWQSSSAVETT